MDDIDDARAWWGVGLAVAAVGCGAQQFAPLLLMYQDELDLTTTTIQAVFGLYVLGLIPGLLLGGPVSDRYGRRMVMAPTLAASVVATVLLMLGGTGIGWLFAGRLVAGVASGAAFSSGAAWIKELSGATAGGARRVTVAMTAGFGLGPLVAGVLAQWAPAPTVLPYVPHLVLAAVAFGPALRASETRRPDGLAGLRQQFASRRSARTDSAQWLCRSRRGCSGRPRSPWPTFPGWSGRTSADMPSRSAHSSRCSRRAPESWCSRWPAGWMIRCARAC